MTIIKLLAKKRISRELFKVCRLNHFETLVQIEEYFSEHGSFDQLKWCGPEEKLELENLVGAATKRLAEQLEVPLELLRSESLVSTAELLLKEKLLAAKQLEIFTSSFRIYQDSHPLTPMALAAHMDLTGTSVLRLRKLALQGVLKGFGSLQTLQEDLRVSFGLDSKDMILIDEAGAQQINARSKTKFSPQFLGLLFGIFLEKNFRTLGNPEEVLAGNYMGIRHYWRGFYLLRREVVAAMDFEALVTESFRLLNNGATEARRLDLMTFVSHFIKNKQQVELDRLLPIAAEILSRELDLRVGEDGKLFFPPDNGTVIRQYAFEALEALGVPSREEVVRGKIVELHPEVYIDSIRFHLVMPERCGFTSYKKLYALQKWFPDGGGLLRLQDKAFLEELTTNNPLRKEEYWKSHWNQMMAEVQEFTFTHGRLPDKEAPAQEKKLWTWLNRQQAFSREGKLDPQQESAYRELRGQFPEHTTPFFKQLWDLRYEEVKSFAEAHGRLPRKFGPEEEKKLNAWYRNQKTKLRKGVLNLRQKILIRSLEDSYGVRKKPVSEEMKVRQLVKFAEAYSRLPQQNAVDEEEQRLNRFWLYLLERMKQGKVDQRRVVLLKDLRRRFPYNKEHHQEAWEKRFEELNNFVEVHGVPRGHDCMGEAKTLRGWLIIQRVRMNKGELNARQQKLLTEFDQRYQSNRTLSESASWNLKFRELENFAQAHSRPPFVRENKNLYHWMNAQRVQLEKGELKPRRKKLIVNFFSQYPIRLSIDPIAVWEEKFTELELFIETFNRLPKFNVEEEVSLYRWFLSQRSKAAKAVLNLEQLSRLQRVFSRFEDKSEEAWNKRLEELATFVRSHSRLPKKKAPAVERSLHYWYKQQLKRMKRGRLDARQKKLLNRFVEPNKKPDWNFRFRELKAFAEAQLRLPRRTSDSEEEQRLYRWILGQTLRLKKGTLKGREEKLFRFLMERYDDKREGYKLQVPADLEAAVVDFE